MLQPSAKEKYPAFTIVQGHSRDYDLSAALTPEKREWPFIRDPRRTVTTAGDFVVLWSCHFKTTDWKLLMNQTALHPKCNFLLRHWRSWNSSKRQLFSLFSRNFVCIPAKIAIDWFEPSSVSLFPSNSNGAFFSGALLNLMTSDFVMWSWTKEEDAGNVLPSPLFNFYWQALTVTVLGDLV